MSERKYWTVREALREFGQALRFAFCFLIGGIAYTLGRSESESPFPDPWYPLIATLVYGIVLSLFWRGFSSWQRLLCVVLLAVAVFSLGKLFWFMPEIR